MFPSFVLFGKTIGLYPLMSLIGIFVAGLFICYLTKKHGYSVDDMITFLLICACGVLLGGHLLYGLINFPLLLEFFSKLGSVSSFEEVD